MGPTWMYYTTKSPQIEPCGHPLSQRNPVATRQRRPTASERRTQTRMSHGGFGQDPGQSRQEHAGYQCLGCKRTWSSLFALGQHTGSPFMRGTRCGSLSSIVELQTVPRANLATGLVRAVPVHASGTLLIRSIYAYCET